MGEGADFLHSLSTPSHHHSYTMIPDILRTITKVRAQHFLGERDSYKVKPSRTFTHRNTYRTLLKYIGKDLGMYEERDPEAIDQGETNTRINREHSPMILNPVMLAQSGPDSSFAG